MAIDVSTVLSGACIGLANLGCVKLLIDRTLKQNDETTKLANAHSVILATVSENLKTTSETLERVQTNVEELYDARNAHKENLTEINALHKFKRCSDMPTNDHTSYQGGKN